MSLSLKKIELEDASFISNLFNDKDNVKYMSTIVRCIDHTTEEIEEEIKDSEEEFEQLFIVLDENNNKVGHAGIDDIDDHDMRGEIFFVIDKKFQGKGYGKEIVKLLLDYGFDNLKLNSLFASVAVLNKSAINVILVNGFKKIGVRREFNKIDDEFIDELFFDMIKEDYDKINK